MVHELNSEEIKKDILYILDYFDCFCKQHKLRYFLSGGTLLGAIRHKGFIPWDDDIDICMPRPDYEKMIKLFSKLSGRYKIISDRLGNFNNPFAKICDSWTLVEQRFCDEKVLGLWIDIMPIDGLPENIAMVKKIYSRVGFWRKLLGLSNCKLGEGSTIFRKWLKYLLKPLVKCYGTHKILSEFEKFQYLYPYETSDYVGAITWGLYGVGERMLKKEFEKIFIVDFEGRKYPTFSCWDSYLHNLYGNYMELPPIKKRKTHELKVYWRINR